MHRIWLIADTRTGSRVLPQAVEGDPGAAWIERVDRLDAARRDLLEYEADILLVSEGQWEVLDRFPSKPAWIEADDAEGGFRARGFDGTLDSLSDVDFEELNEMLENPATSLDAFGDAAAKKAKAKTFHTLLAEATLVASLLPLLAVAIGELLQGKEHGLVFLEQFLILVSFGFAIVLWRSSSKTRWTRSRIAREIWRSLKSSMPFVDPIRPVHAVPFRRYRGVLRSLLAKELGLTLAQQRAAKSGNVVTFPREHEDFSRARRAYIDDRILGDNGQLRHYTEKRDEARRRHNFLRWCFIVASGASAVCALVSIAWALDIFADESGDIKRFFYDFGGYFFPALAAGCIGLIGLYGAGVRAGLYQIMAGRLNEARLALEACQEEDAFRELVSETEAVLLWEVNGWANMNEF